MVVQLLCPSAHILESSQTWSSIEDVPSEALTAAYD